MSNSPKNLNLASKESVSEFLSSFDTIFTDCDGVLWLENQKIENSDRAMNKLRDLGKTIFYITNNSTKTRDEFVTKCQNLGFKANWDDIINTAYLVAEYISSIKFDKKVYVVGSKGLIKELDRFGIKHTESGPDVLTSTLESYVQKEMILDPEVGCVLVGFDEHFSYPKMLKAANYLKNPDCLFIATNADENLTLNNLIIPGTGSLLKSLETATGRTAFVIGKPNEYIKEAVKKNFKIDSSRTLMIGDRCNTDILFGKRCGFKTLLVLSGVTSPDELSEFVKTPERKDLVPEFYINKLGDLLHHLQ